MNKWLLSGVAVAVRTRCMHNGKKSANGFHGCRFNKRICEPRQKKSKVGNNLNPKRSTQNLPHKTHFDHQSFWLKNQRTTVSRLSALQTTWQ